MPNKRWSQRRHPGLCISRPGGSGQLGVLSRRRHRVRDHPGILDITHGQCSMTPNAARRGSLTITRLPERSPCRALSRAERLARTVSDRPLFGSLVAIRGGERLSERNASISTSWRPYPYRSRTPQRGPAMFRDRHYGSRPFCEVVISHTTPRGRSGKQAGEPPPE
jgi:hypothetical protein